MSDILADLRAVLELRGDTYSSAEVWGMVSKAANEIERLTSVIEDAIETMEAMDLHADNPLYDRLVLALTAAVGKEALR